MKKAIPSLLMAGALAVSAGVQAATVTDSFLTPLSTTELSNETGSLDLFDGSLGNLTSVTVEISAHSVSSTIINNTAAQDQTFAYNSGLNFIYDSTLSPLDSVLTGDLLFSPDLQTILADTGGPATVASQGSLDLGSKTDDSSRSFTFTGSDLAAFIGAGTFDISCSTQTNSQFVGGGGNLTAAQNTQAQCDGTVTYDYDVANNVPEPAAAWLIGAGLLGFVGFRAKKSS